MPGCAAINCKNRSNNGFKLYRFPADLERRNQWLMNCKRGEWKPSQNDRLCSVHFEETQFEQRRADQKRHLMPYAVPTLFPNSDPRNESSSTRKRTRKKRPHQFEQSEESAELDSMLELNYTPLNDERRIIELDGELEPQSVNK